ncbi:24154_t:CDS:2, partial [Dentiscutata erythropus]
LKIHLGRVLPSVYISALIALLFIETLEFTLVSSALDSWTWDQLRIMKVGGNAAALDYFSKYGGSTSVNNKDGKLKYTSRVALKYKDELVKRAKEDAK